TIEAAGANLDASVEEYDDVLVTLLSDVATAYVQMRTLQQRIAHAERNVAIQRFSYQIALDKKGIFATPLDVDQALSILKQTEALIPELEISLRQTTNQLCILLGIPPEELQAKLRPGTTAFPANGAAAVGLGASLWGAGPWSVINTELFLAGR